MECKVLFTVSFLYQVGRGLHITGKGDGKQKQEHWSTSDAYIISTVGTCHAYMISTIEYVMHMYNA